MNTPPSDLIDAANWLVDRHPWLQTLVGRFGGTTGDWLERLANAVREADVHGREWEAYEARRPAPVGDAYERDGEAWEAAGPGLTPLGAVFVPMSAGEKRVLRLVATLSPQGRVEWSAYDIGFDQRGEAIMEDWLTIVRAQVQ